MPLRYDILCALRLTILDYGAHAIRYVDNAAEVEVEEKVKELVTLGEYTPKANYFPWQNHGANSFEPDVMTYDGMSAPHTDYI